MLRKVASAAAAVGVGLIAGRIITARGTSAPDEHTTQSEESYRSARRRVLILGAGFGGVAAALELDQKLRPEDDVSVLVVDNDNNLLFTPLLWTVADGRADASHVLVPIRAFQKGRRFHVLHAEVQEIDLVNREVRTSAGSRPYDDLVIALGSTTAVPDLPGLRERALVFHSPADAVELRNHLIDAVEAAHRASDPDEQREWLTFVIGGGGDTGIELAATIHTYIYGGLFKEYPWLAQSPTRVMVVGRADRLVPMSPPATSSAVRKALESQGIEVLTGASVCGVTERSVQTSAGDIPARTLFWAAGIAAPPVVRDLPAEHARNGALLVDASLRLKGYENVYVVGDSAWAYDSESGQPLPPTAQAAGHQGKYVAAVISNNLHGVPSTPFVFAPIGHLALLGRGTGVAEFKGLTFTGPIAWLMWHGYYLWRIPSWRNRVRLATDLLMAAITGRELGQLRLTPSTNNRLR